MWFCSLANLGYDVLTQSGLKMTYKTQIWVKFGSGNGLLPDGHQAMGYVGLWLD